MSKIQIISDNNSKSLKIKKSLLKVLKKEQIKRKNLVIVIGGDGFMLQTLKKDKDRKKLFYGVNSGNYGFLMNKFSSKKINNNLDKANMISIFPLVMTVKNNKNQIVFTNLLKAGEEYNVPNEAGLKLETGNAGALEILVDGKAVPSIGQEGMVRRSVQMDPALLKAGTAARQ